jgi:hypothetical protein
LPDARDLSQSHFLDLFPPYPKGEHKDGLPHKLDYRWPGRRLPACKAPAFAPLPFFKEMHPMLYIHTFIFLYVYSYNREREFLSGLEPTLCSGLEKLRLAKNSITGNNKP